MENGIITKEYYVGRYLYLTDLLANKLPKVTFNHLDGKEVLSITFRDASSRSVVRKRITPKNREWDKYRTIAVSRLKAEQVL